MGKRAELFNLTNYNTMKPYKELYERAAGHFLYALLPSDWFAWDDELFYKYLQDHACEDYQHCDGEHIAELIDTLAYDYKKLIEEVTQ
jgi:hypothetical protein